MKKVKSKPNPARTGPVAAVAALVAGQAKEWSDLSQEIERCEVVDGERRIVDPFRLAPLLSRIETQFRANGAGAQPELEQLRNWVEQEWKRLAATFEHDLRASCERAEYAVEGSFPDFVLNGLLSISADIRKGHCRVGLKALPTMLVSAVMTEVGGVLAEEAKRDFHPEEFIEQLFEAYRRLRAVSGRDAVVGILAKEILPELAYLKQSASFRKSPQKAAFTEYPVELFSRDLGRLLQSGALVTKGGLRLQTAPVSNSSDGVPVLIDGAHRYVGRVIFAEDQKL